MKKALINKSSEYLESSFSFLKSHYRFIGIFTIVMLALYPFSLVFGIVFGFMSGMH